LIAVWRFQKNQWFITAMREFGAELSDELVCCTNMATQMKRQIKAGNAERKCLKKHLQRQALHLRQDRIAQTTLPGFIRNPHFTMILGTGITVGRARTESNTTIAWWATRKSYWTNDASQPNETRSILWKRF
jgi:hypothetical protein